MRNPLNAIFNNVDLLRSGLSCRREILDTYNVKMGTAMMAYGVAGRQQLAFDEEALDAIESCAKHQRVITNDVLHLSKLKSGNVVLTAKEFDPCTMIRQIVGMFRAELKSKGLEFTTDVQWDGGTVLGDPERLGQVLINLLSNAIKFTEKVRVAVGKG